MDHPPKEARALFWWCSMSLNELRFALLAPCCCCCCCCCTAAITLVAARSTDSLLGPITLPEANVAEEEEEEEDDDEEDVTLECCGDSLLSNPIVPAVLPARLIAELVREWNRRGGGGGVIKPEM